MQLLIKANTVLILFLAISLGPFPALAQQSTNTELSELYTQVEKQRDRVEEIKFKLSSAVGDDVVVIEEQLQRTRTNYQKDLWKLATRISESSIEATFAPEVRTLLEKESAFLQKQILSTKEALSTEQIKLSSYIDTPPPDNLIADAIRHFTVLVSSYGSMLNNINAKGVLDMDVAEDTKLANQWIQDEADLLVGRAELVKERIKVYKGQLGIYQPESAEYKSLQTKIKGQQLRLDFVAQGLSQTAGLIERLGKDASVYQEAVIRATGKLSEDVLDVRVVRRLFTQWGENLKQWVVVRGPEILANIATFIIILVLAWVVARLIQRLLRRALANAETGIGTLARDFIVSISSKIVMLIGVIIALGSIGVQVGHILAGVGVLGIVVGFALQDTLSNFASGIMILIYRPYDVGDYIHAAGVEGQVRKMSLVATTVYTVENHRLMLPNNKVWGDIIRNVTSQHVRRVDLMFGVSYDEDIDHVKTVLKSVLDEHDKVLKSPEAMIRVHELADSSVNFIVRPWVPSDDYWEVYWDLTEQVKKRFDEEGISIPFPQRDFHLIRDRQSPT